MRARCLFPLLIAGAIAGCFDDRGTVLELDVGAVPTTKTVELFLTHQQCDPQRDACDALRPKDRRPLGGDIWYRDTAAPITTDVRGHKATFRLEAGSADATLSLVIAVGLDSGGAPTGFQTLTQLSVPVNGSKIVEASLEAASQLADPADDAGVLIWDTPAGAATPSSCVAIAHVDSDGVVSRTFIVPTDDLDCDGKLEAQDCAPNAYPNGNMETFGQPTNDPGKTCAIMTGPACALGTIGCASDGSDVTCRRQVATTCFPGTVCSACPSDMSLEACVGNWGNVQRIDCKVPKHDIGSCDHEATVKLVVPELAGTCKDAEIAVVAKPLVFDDRATFSGVELDVSAEKTCTIKVVWKGNELQGGDEDQYGLIRIATTTGNAIIPLSLHFTDDTECTKSPPTGFSCTPAIFNDLSLWSCLQ